MLLIAISVAALCFLVSSLTSAMILVIQDGFGASDFTTVELWTFAFAVVHGILFFPAAYLLIRLSLLVGYIAAGGLGAVNAIAWSLFVTLVLGPAVGAFSIPPLPGWIVGAVTSSLAGISILAIARWRAEGNSSAVSTIKVILFPLLLMSLMLGLTATSVRSIRSSVPSVVVVRWEPNSRFTGIDDPGNLLSEEERKQLLLLNLGGRLTPQSGSVGGVDVHSRVIVIMQKPINEQVQLPLPDDTSITYIQGEEAWEKYPRTAAVLERNLTLQPFTYESGQEATQFCFDLGPGIRCYGGILWTSSP
ncbi:MAG TPA: hypothetical protein VK905_04985 [Bacillota bacterium]|nr:hypothetical protein [Bacillota bacterium]